MKEDIIIAVQNRPALWDKRHKQHHNRHVLDKEWKEIAKELQVTEKVVKQIWKNLRQEFRKQFAKTIKSGAAAPETPSWKYFNSMAFLNDQFLPRTDLTTRTGFKKRITTQAAIGRELVLLEKEKLKLKLQKSEDKANDEDVGFFNSLLPHVRTLNPREKMLFRMKVQDILFDMAYSAEPPSSSSPPSTVSRPRMTYHSTTSQRYSPYDSSSHSTIDTSPSVP